MPAPGSPPRFWIGLVYVGLVLLPCLLIARASTLSPKVIGVTFVAYAFALFPTYFLDHAFLGGVGFHSPVIFALFAILTASFLWPLAVLTVSPLPWRSRPWRFVMGTYSAIFVCLALLAGWQMTRNFGLFFD